MSFHPPHQPTPPLRRSHRGRWLGGVCHGIAERTGMPVVQVRALTVLASLLFGVGVLAYLVCWLVLPTEGETAEEPALMRGLASAALVLAAGAGLAGLAGFGAIATLIGFGWAVAIAIGVLLVGTLVAWPAIRPAWVLPPLVALALAAVAVGASGVRILPQTGAVSVRPTSVADLPSGPYLAGLGDLLVDLRGLPLRAGQTIPIRIEAWIGQTVVALPNDRCVNVEVHADFQRSRLVRTALARFGGYYGSSSVVLFGDEQRGESGTWVRRTTDPHAATVRIDYRTARGGLWLRDYPQRVSPLADRYWPDSRSLMPPPSPEERNPAWGPSVRTPAVQRRWREWKPRLHRFEHEQSRRRAGACATTRTTR